MARIVSIGSALQDVFLIDHDDFGVNQRGFLNQLELGTKVDIDNIHFSVGGGAINTATTFARHGHETIFMGCIANDPAGTAIINALDDEGIDTSYINYLTKTHTGCSVLLLSPTGERTILTCRGASARFETINPADLDTIHPDWLYVSTLRGNMDVLDRLFAHARKLGAKIMFNPGNLELTHQRQLLGLLSDVEVLLLNKSEAKQLVPGRTLVELASHLSSYVPTVIITDGGQGAIAANAGRIIRIGIYEDVKVKDSTGAGDAFGSGFLAHYADNADLEKALVFASANSTSVVQHIGSRDGILSKGHRVHQMPIQELR